MSHAQRALGRLFPAQSGPGRVLRAGKDAARTFRSELSHEVPEAEPVDRGPGLTDYAEWRAQQPPLEPLPAGQTTTFLVIVETSG